MMLTSQNSEHYALGVQPALAIMRITMTRNLYIIFLKVKFTIPSLCVR